MIGKLRQNLLVACLVISSVTVFYLGRHAMECHHRAEDRVVAPLLSSLHATLRTGHNLSSPFVYNKDMPLIFIGGVPRSGTTLMRAMLDAHPDVRCGEETRVIPRILAMKQMWSRSGREKMRLDEAGVTDEVLDAAMQAFLLEIIVKHGEPAAYLCNKDPFALKSLSYLAKIFPRAKFILMIRDGRASVHSMISRKVTIAGFDLNSYRDCLTKWNRAIETMYTQCLEAADKCLPMHYEQLVLHPEKWMRTLLKFLDIPWNEAVLHHEELIGKAGGVSLSNCRNLQKSQTQVRRRKETVQTTIKANRMGHSRALVDPQTHAGTSLSIYLSLSHTHSHTHTHTHTHTQYSFRGPWAQTTTWRTLAFDVVL
uniref:Protein-tyrosine sulfotransferase n=1 Tax=Electrophorus electricus TaxID=8005 RepID=A0A4W4HTJ1_ELEEL